MARQKETRVSMEGPLFEFQKRQGKEVKMKKYTPSLQSFRVRSRGGALVVVPALFLGAVHSGVGIPY